MKKFFFLWVLMFVPILLSGQTFKPKVSIAEKAVGDTAYLRYAVLQWQVAPGDTRAQIGRLFLPVHLQDQLHRIRGRSRSPDVLFVGEVVTLVAYPWELASWDVGTQAFWRAHCNRPDALLGLIEHAEYYEELDVSQYWGSRPVKK